jgi:hypothetical protein
MENCHMKKRKQLSSEEAKRVGDSLYVDWDQIDLEQFRQGLMGKHKQGVMDPETGSAYDSVLLSGKIVLAHMQDFPDYFTRLARLRAEVSQYRARGRQRKQVSM